MEDEKNVAKITLTYKDDTTEDIDKGIVAQFVNEGGKTTMSVDLLDIKGEELKMLVTGFLELGDKAGFFDDMKG